MGPFKFGVTVWKRMIVGKRAQLKKVQEDRWKTEEEEEEEKN